MKKYKDVSGKELCEWIKKLSEDDIEISKKQAETILNIFHQGGYELMQNDENMCYKYVDQEGVHEETISLDKLLLDVNEILLEKLIDTKDVLRYDFSFNNIVGYAAELHNYFILKGNYKQVNDILKKTSKCKKFISSLSQILNNNIKENNKVRRLSKKGKIYGA